jgi:hypothetical protein
MLFPFILIVFGISYIAKPDMFKRGLWKETAITQRILSPVRYRIYMRVLGLIFIVAGIVMLLTRK